MHAVLGTLWGLLLVLVPDAAGADAPSPVETLVQRAGNAEFGVEAAPVTVRRDRNRDLPCGCAGGERGVPESESGD